VPGWGALTVDPRAVPGAVAGAFGVTIVRSRSRPLVLTLTADRDCTATTRRPVPGRKKADARYIFGPGWEF